MFLIAQLILFLLMVAASEQDCSNNGPFCNVPSCSGGCDEGDFDNRCYIRSGGASTDISGSFIMGLSNQFELFDGNLKVADGASIDLVRNNHFLAYFPGATIQLLKDAKLTAFRSNNILFQYNNDNGPFTASFGESSMTTLGNSVNMEINGAFQLGSNSTFHLKDSSSFLLATASSRFVTGESVNLYLGPSSITTLNQGHQLEMSSNSFLFIGNQSSYTGLQGSKLESFLPGIGIQIQSQAKLVVKEHSFCLIHKKVTIPAQTTVILSSSGQGLPDGVTFYHSEAGLKVLKEKKILKQ